MGEREGAGEWVGASVLEALHTVYGKGLVQAGIIKIVALERMGYWHSTQAKTGPADRGKRVRSGVLTLGTDRWPCAELCKRTRDICGDLNRAGCGRECQENE